MMEDRQKLAALLREAAAQTISEGRFWADFNALCERIREPVVEVAMESAIHYWGAFHERSVFFFVPLKPNPGQVEQGRNELNLIAEGLEAGWTVSVLEGRLKAI